MCLQEPWVLSFPMMASFLCLMTNPTKTESNPNLTHSDRDISWGMDSLQAFCRLKGPGEGERDLSFSLGTYPDCWIYLHFVLHFFHPDVERENPDKSPDCPPASGLRCDRRSLEAEGIGSFKEARILVNLRCAVGCVPGASINPSPSTVGIILTDLGHQSINAKEKDWRERELESSSPYSGIALFQNIVWNHIDVWKDRWDQCLDHVDSLLETKVSI